MNGCYLLGCQKPQIQANVDSLTNDLLAVAHDEHVSPHMQRRILTTMARYGLFKGDVDAVVAQHPNYRDLEVADHEYNQAG